MFFGWTNNGSEKEWGEWEGDLQRREQKEYCLFLCRWPGTMRLIRRGSESDDGMLCRSMRNKESVNEGR